MKAFRWAVVSYLWVWVTALVCSYVPPFLFHQGHILFRPSYYLNAGFADRLLRLFLHSDSKLYPLIALSGYKDIYYAFFPGWIWVLKFLGIIFNIKSPAVLAFAGSIVNFGFLWLAIRVWTEIAEIFGIKGMEKFLGFYPASVFFVAAYPEIMFIALGGLVMSCAIKGSKWGVLGYLPLFILSKHAGIVMGVSFVVWALMCRRRILPWALMGWLIGVAAVFFFYSWQAGDPLIWLKAQAAWGRKLSYPWAPIVELFGKSFELVFYVFILYSVPFVFALKLYKEAIKSFSVGFSVKRQAELLVFLYVCSLYVPLWFGNSIQSLYRIIVLGTPALFIGAWWFKLDAIYGRRWLVAGVFLVLNILSTYRFVVDLFYP